MESLCIPKTGQEIAINSFNTEGLSAGQGYLAALSQQ